MRTALLLAACFALLPAGLSAQSRPSKSHSSRVRLVTRAQGHQILQGISALQSPVVDGSDCSHLVHGIYAQAGFPYDYASSRDLYFGAEGFFRVRSPQAGDLVVWLGHVGIVTDPKHHAFFSSVSDGPAVQAYNSRYWRSRGKPRFYRYVLRGQTKTDSAALRTDD
jgi:cell wall-associated NlpC family hydrolase